MWIFLSYIDLYSKTLLNILSTIIYQKKTEVSGKSIASFGNNHKER